AAVTAASKSDRSNTSGDAVIAAFQGSTGAPQALSAGAGPYRSGSAGAPRRHSQRGFGQA
ncbi:hypothetical protein, partial [Rhodovulum sulfidophilum]|uniref:hypothetical protein n=1 Tax=Rhodovulum sulfidophilum TaxID=35806 RepID=UPI001F349096